MAEKTPKKQVSVTIDGEVADWLKAEAEERMVAPAYLVERALRAFRTTLAGNSSATHGAVVAAIDSLRATRDDVPEEGLG